MFHLTDRELALLGEATRKETLALVGWMALANAFGNVCEHPVNFGEELPGSRAASWVGSLSRVAQRRESAGKRKYRQDVVSNRKRKVKARKASCGLATGR